MHKSGTRTSFVLSGNHVDILLGTAVGIFEGGSRFTGPQWLGENWASPSKQRL